MLLDKLKMEFLGTFVIVYFTGMLYIQFSLETIDMFGLAAGCFFIYSIMIWAGKSISGAQFNPVVTVFLGSRFRALSEARARFVDFMGVSPSARADEARPRGGARAALGR